MAKRGAGPSKAELKRRDKAAARALEKACQQAAGMVLTWRDLPPEVQARLRKEPGTNVPTDGSVFVLGKGTEDDPFNAILEFDVGWCWSESFGVRHDLDFFTRDLWAFREDRELTRDDVSAAVMRFMVRCYCHECLTPLAHDDARVETLRAELELRRTVARANEISLDGTPESEARIDAILQEEGKEDLARQLAALLRSNGGRLRTSPATGVPTEQARVVEPLTGWAAKTGDPDVGRVFDYLERHETLAEDALVKLLGSPRKARAVALRLHDFTSLGFEVKVTVPGPESPRIFQRVR